MLVSNHQNNKNSLTVAMQRGAARREGARSEEILHLGIMMVVCVSISVFISVCSLQLNSAVLDV